MVSPEKRVLLVDPPLEYQLTVLSLPTLKAILERGGCPTDTLSGTLLFPRVRGDAVRERIRAQFAQFYFTPHLFPSVSRESSVSAIVDSMREIFGLQGAWSGAETILNEFGMDAEHFRRVVFDDIDKSGVCLDRCVERARDPAYDVVGFSCTFETQIPAAIAIATRLKAERPDVVILFGGAALFGPPAEELVRSFPIIDAACHVEGDDIIVPLVHAVRAPAAERAARLAAVPGIAWRDGGAVRVNAAPPLLFDMDSLPVPNYDDYVVQRAASEYADLPMHLLFETSRGCWYGEKRICSFCGLNNEGIAFRKKSADRVFDEVRALHERYPTAERLSATDNILSMDYLKTVLPRLTEWRRTQTRPLRLFFEVKANLRRDQVRVMRDAGVDWVQPGIESFNDGILKLMAKGSTGLGQVATVKWLSEEHIGNVYHLIVMNPLETPQQYREMEALVPFIEHLPPGMLTSMELQRFSPYFTDPARYGITNVRPRPYYAWAYPVPGIDVGKLAYRFDYDHEMFADAELTAARRSFVKRALRWGETWRPDMLYYREADDWLVIHDQRGLFPHKHSLTGLAREVFRYVDAPRTWDQIQAHFSDVSPELLRSLLDGWVRRRWAARDGERYLVVVPEKMTHDAPARARGSRTRETRSAGAEQAAAQP